MESLLETAQWTVMEMVKAKLQLTALLWLQASPEVKQRTRLSLEIQSRRRLSAIDG
jgi:hypothetical protein